MKPLRVGFCYPSFLLASGLLLGFWNLDSCAGISLLDSKSLVVNAALSASCLAPTNVQGSIYDSTTPSEHGLINTSDIYIDKSPSLSASENLVVISQPEDTDQTTPVIPSSAVGNVIDPDIYGMMQKYKGRFIYCSLQQCPTVDILLCGTLHVAQTSANMVEDAIKVLRPSYIVLELCEERVDSLYDQEVRDVTFSDVIRGSYSVRSLKVLVMGLLTWMQLKAAKILGSTLGEEQILAAKVGEELGSTVILGDRLYSVTIQRIFDSVKLFEKIKLVIVGIWEILTLNLNKMKDYIKKSENQKGFIEDEITRFAKHLPKLAKVLIEERDEYLAQTLYDTAQIISDRESRGPSAQKQRRLRVMAVVGAGHLAGIQRCLAAGGSSDERLMEISCSSKHPAPGMWQGRGMFKTLIPRSMQQEILPDELLVSEPYNQPQQQQQQHQQQQQQQQEIEYQTQYESETAKDSHQVVDNLEQQHDTGIFSHSDALLIDEEEYEEVSDVSEIEDDLIQDDIIISGVGGGEGGGEGEGEARGIRELEEHEDAVVRLMATLTPVVKRAYTAMSIATSTPGLVLSHELLTHFALFEEAFKDAKKAFMLTDAAENKSDSDGDSGSDPFGSADMERQLYGVSNAVIRAEVAAKAVIEEAEMLVENFNK